MSQLQKYYAANLVHLYKCGSGKPSSFSSGCELYPAAEVDAALADLRQYHDWASPQVQRLGEEVVAREAAEAREQQLKTAITTALAQLVGEWPMRARKTLREALAQASAQAEQKPQHVCGAYDYFYAVHEKGLPRCPACVSEGR